MGIYKWYSLNKAITEDIQTQDENHWSVDHVIDLIYDEEYSELWDFIEYTYKKYLPVEAIEALGSCPIEYLFESQVQNISIVLKDHQ
jgi:hypothetical protein